MFFFSNIRRQLYKHLIFSSVTYADSRLKKNCPITFSTGKKMFYPSYVDLNGFFIGHAFVRERNGKFVVYRIFMRRLTRINDGFWVANMN